MSLTGKADVGVADLCNVGQIRRRESRLNGIKRWLLDRKW